MRQNSKNNFIILQMEKKESGTKKFTDQEKLRIIEEVKSKGLKVTLEKYDLYP